MGRLFDALLVLVSLLYPFAVYYGLSHWSPRVMAAVLLGLWAARGLRARAGAAALPAWMIGMMIGFATLALIAGRSLPLRWYPVFVNALLLVVFASSLWRGPPLIERLARLRHPDLPPAGVRYTRSVTRVWCIFFLCNGGLAAATALWADWPLWTLYNGGLAYVAMGLLFGIEWLVRRQRMSDSAR